MVNRTSLALSGSLLLLVLLVTAALIAFGGGATQQGAQGGYDVRVYKCFLPTDSADCANSQ